MTMAGQEGPSSPIVLTEPRLNAQAFLSPADTPFVLGFRRGPNNYCSAPEIQLVAHYRLLG